MNQETANYIMQRMSKFLEETVLVEEPRYHQKFQAFKYEVEIDGQKKVFAAKEYSMGIYMYFIEE